VTFRGTTKWVKYVEKSIERKISDSFVVDGLSTVD